jgi:RNA polymerase sigma-70 factor (ECF subfamily)
MATSAEASTNDASVDRTDLTDEQLIERYRSNDVESFETLVRRYRQELFHFLIRFAGGRAAAEDVFQEAFLQVHLSIDTFDTSRRFKPWLFTIAANKARDYLRRRGRRPAMPLSAPIGDDQSQSFADLMEADLPMPGERLEEEELGQRVRTAVDELPDHLREILMLAYFQKFSYNEIADILGIPLGTVKSRLHTAVGKFAEKWKSVNRDEPAA